MTGIADDGLAVRVPDRASPVPAQAGGISTALPSSASISAGA